MNMRNVYAKKTEITILGHVLDNETSNVLFDVTDVFNICGTGGTFAIRNRRSCDTDAYPISASKVSLVDNVLTWTLTSADMYAGFGEAQVSYTLNSKVLMSIVYRTECKSSLGSSGTAPDPWTGYVSDVQTNANKAEAAVTHYPYINSTNKHWMVWDATNSAWVDTDITAEGTAGATGNGISSISKTSTSGLVDTYTIYFTNGTTTTFTVTNGSGGGDMYKSVYSPNYTGELASAAALTAEVNDRQEAVGDVQDELDAHTENVNNPHSVTATQVGLGNVGNFKAVSTEASQGLTSTEKNNARSNIDALTNLSTGDYSVTIEGNSSSIRCGTNVGANSSANTYQTSAFGCDAQATGQASTAVGYNAKTNAAGAVQIGTGTNANANTFQIGSYQMMDSSGKIPDERISSTIVNGAALGATALQSVPSTYRTASAQDVIDSGKQDTISDLATIRSNASSGASKISCTESQVSTYGFTKNTGTVSSLSDLGITATSTEINYVDGVASNVQTQLNAKGTYSKPSDGIPKTDLASSVQTSLGKADTVISRSSSLTAWNQEIMAGSVTPSITLPTPTGTIVEEITYIFTAASTNASFTAPSGYIVCNEDGTSGLSAGNTLAYTDLTSGSIYECSFKPVSSTVIRLIMTETKTA